MPADLVSRINLDLLYPPFLEQLLETLAECRYLGFDYYAICGTRTWEEQAHDYAKGRTIPGPKVTNAPPGFSCHNYGLAVDTCHDLDLVKPGLQMDWAPGHYQCLQNIGPKHGLQVGVQNVAGGDVGHIQLPLVERLKRKEKDILAELRGYYDAGGLKAVWSHLDTLDFATHSC